MAIHGPRLDAAVLEAINGVAGNAFVRPGDRVVLKPNWVKECDERYADDKHWDYVVTHPSVVEATAEWVATQLGGEGSIVICDAPQTDSSFDKLRRYCGLDDMVARLSARFPGVDISLLDLRPEEWIAVDGVVVEKRKLTGDPSGATHVQLNADSEFVDFSGLGQLYGASYNMQETNDRHSGQRHEYLLCRTPMDADVLINLPKMKTHKKVGITCALKNLVGINANKNWLPHHTEGTPDQGGDQYPSNTVSSRLEQTAMARLKQLLYGRHGLSKAFVPIKKLGKKILGNNQQAVRSGNWYGNDTCWRMVLDLNKCLFYYDGQGKPRTKPLRYLAVVDGIIGGQGNGPMAPDPYPSGVIVAGTNPVAVDCTCAALMGFDWRKIKMLSGAFACHTKPLITCAPEEITVVSNEPRWCKPLTEFGAGDAFEFLPHFGWKKAIEFDPAPELVNSGSA